MPTASVITANIGTPSTKAANIRWTWAAIQIAARLPMSGNARYAPAVSATLWRSRSGSVMAQEEGLLRGEIERHRAPDFGEQLGRDDREALLARVLLDALDHDAAHEAGDARQSLARALAPLQRGPGARAAGH